MEVKSFMWQTRQSWSHSDHSPTERRDDEDHLGEGGKGYKTQHPQTLTHQKGPTMVVISRKIWKQSLQGRRAFSLESSWRHQSQCWVGPGTSAASRTWCSPCQTAHAQWAEGLCRKFCERRGSLDKIKQVMLNRQHSQQGRSEDVLFW